MNIILERLSKEKADAEERQRTAARRVAWLEHHILNSANASEFEERNAELEKAAAELKERSLQLRLATVALASAEIEERNINTNRTDTGRVDLYGAIRYNQ